MDLVSVIIPIYGVEQYLDRCVRSVVNQSYAHLEIILVDDGSTDRCPAMCDAWANKDSRIQVIHKSNGGLSSARNAGLDMATGEFIAFVDSDDYVEPDYIATMIDAAQKNHAGSAEQKPERFQLKADAAERLTGIEIKPPSDHYQRGEGDQRLISDFTALKAALQGQQKQNERGHPHEF